MIGLDNRTGRRPCLVERDIRRIYGLRDTGATVHQIAEVMDINVRTAYRYMASHLHHVEVAGWLLTFLVYEHGQRRPTLLSGRGRG